MSEIFSLEISVPHFSVPTGSKSGTEISNEKISDMEDYYMVLNT
jgi:hypothetical protein